MVEQDSTPMVCQKNDRNSVFISDRCTFLVGINTYFNHRMRIHISSQRVMDIKSQAVDWNDFFCHTKTKMKTYVNHHGLSLYS